MSVEKKSVGLIGCGAYGRVHARAYCNDPRTRLKALWSPTRERREAVAREFGCSAAADWRGIIDDPEIHCVSIATPDFAHTEYAIAALKAGKHVLVEKPLATTSDECQRIIKARDAGGAKLMVNYHNRWWPPFKAAYQTVRSVKIGRPVSGNFTLSNTISWVEQHMSWGDKSGPEWFLMSHIVDLAFWILGKKPVEVFAMAREGLLRSKGVKTRDLVKAMVRMEDGAVIHFESSWIVARNWRNPVNEMWISVQGESGRVDVTGDADNVVITADRHETPFVDLSSTEFGPIHDFISCVLENKPVPVSGEEGLLATRVIEAVLESCKRGVSVKLD